MTIPSNHYLSVTEHPQRLAKDLGGLKGCCNFFGHSFKLALVIIGSVGAAGLMSGVSIGGCAVGLSASLALASCCTGARYKNKPRAGEMITDIIFAVAMTILGSLAIAGILPPTTMGWCLLAPTLAFITLEILKTFCIGLKARQES